MRMRRVKNEGEGYYHLVSRCVRKEFLLDVDEKKAFVEMMWRLADFSGIEVLTHCVLSNHFHLLVHVPRKHVVGEEELLRRVRVLYGKERESDMRARWTVYKEKNLVDTLAREQNMLRKRMGDISPFMQTLKQRFTVWFRSHHNDHEGTLWQGRFSSTLVEGGGSLTAVAAYIDLNPVRAGIVTDPKDYLFSGYGAAVAGHTASRQGLIRVYGNKTRKFEEVAEAHRGLLYVKGTAAMPTEEVQQVLKKHGKLPLPMLLRCKVRAMNCGLAIGSKAFADKIFSTHRYAFSVRRRKAATGISLCREWDGIQLCSVRHLQKAPVTFKA